MKASVAIPLVRLAVVLVLTWLATSLRSSHGGVLLESAIFAASMYCLISSASIFVDFALALGQKLRISELGAGALIIAIGTSAPELFSSVAAAAHDKTDVVVGNVLGTVIANTFLGIGIPVLALRKTLPVHGRILATKMPVFGGSVLLCLASLVDGELTRIEATLLLLVLAGYLRHTALDARREHEGESEEDGHETVQAGFPLLILGAALGLLGLYVSGELVVASLLEGAALLGVSSVKLATSVLAVGTSVPEIVTAIALVKRNRFDGLFGEILGSNIFDILGIFGVIGLAVPIVMSGPMLWFLVAAMIAMYLIAWHMMHDRSIEPIEGGVLVALAFQFFYMLALL